MSGFTGIFLKHNSICISTILAKTLAKNAICLLWKLKLSSNIQEKQNLTEQHEIHFIIPELARKPLQEDRDLGDK